MPYSLPRPTAPTRPPCIAPPRCYAVTRCCNPPQLAARSVHLGEYLYKWRAVALPLLGSEWELRYWVLSGTTLSYYHSARDIGFSPREEISVMVGVMAQ